MKRAVAFSFLLACAGVLLADSPDSRGPSRDSRSLLQDLVRMTNGGFSDETVLVYAKAHRLELPSEVSTEDLLWLRKSGVGEPVIRYMSAIDVRATDGGAREDDADDAGYANEAAGYSAAADSYSDDDYDNSHDSDYGSYSDGYYDNYPETYYNDYYPAYGAGYYPYPVYFFVNHSGFFGRFRGRGHGRGFVGHRGRGFDHGGFGRQRVLRGDFDRSLGRRRGSVIVDHRGPGRAGISRGYPGQGFRGPRGGVIGRGVPAQRAFPRGGFGQGPRGPRGPVVRNGGFGRPGFSGGGRSGGFGRPGFAGGGHSGGSVGRGPVARSGGSRGPVGGRGRR